MAFSPLSKNPPLPEQCNLRSPLSMNTSSGVDFVHITGPSTISDTVLETENLTFLIIFTMVEENFELSTPEIPPEWLNLTISLKILSPGEKMG